MQIQKKIYPRYVFVISCFIQATILEARAKALKMGLASGTCTVTPYKFTLSEKSYFDPIAKFPAATLYLYYSASGPINNSNCATALAKACKIEYQNLVEMSLAVSSKQLTDVSIDYKTLRCEETGLPEPVNVKDYREKPLSPAVLKKLREPYSAPDYKPNPNNILLRIWEDLNPYQKGIAILGLLAFLGWAAGSLPLILATIFSNYGMATGAVLLLINMFGLDQSKYLPPGTTQAWIDEGYFEDFGKGQYVFKWKFENQWVERHVRFMGQYRTSGPIMYYSFEVNGTKLKAPPPDPVDLY